MSGRDDDLANLRRILDQPVNVVGLHAASGTGKSSLLAGALVPTLRGEGRPVAFERHPGEAGLAARLLADLVETDDVGVDLTARSFIDQLVAVRQLAAGCVSPPGPQGGLAPVLIIDQFEDLLKDDAAIPHGESNTAARATMGMLLAASAQRLPGLAGPPCRWLLAYRQEYHGKLVEWLEDVLHDARALGLEGVYRLPHDLSEASRFVTWPLRPLATPPPRSSDPVAAATRVFLEAIEKPLRHETFPWTFAPGHAERLARAFAEARVRRPAAPLAPKLQVVLAHLLEQAREPSGVVPLGELGEKVVVIVVPDEPADLIDRALEQHLRRALDFAFPQGGTQGNAAVRTARTRALLVLRELADVHGRREKGHAADALARALGAKGREVLEKLSTPRTRLVLRERHGGTLAWVLAHDRLAEILVQVVDNGHWAELGIDAELLGQRRFVALQSELYASGDVEQATAAPRGWDHVRKIEVNKEVLFWRDQNWAWWQACRTRWRLDRRRSMARRIVAAVVVALVALGAWTVADRRARRQALLAEVAAGEAEVAFAALDRLTREEGAPDMQEELLEQLRAREAPFDIFEYGLGGVGEERRAEVLARVAELALPILETSPEDPVLIANFVWALDSFAGADHALALRDKALEPLRRSRPPPPRPTPGDPDWADIPAGTFLVGAEGRDHPDLTGEKPRHQVTLSAFRIMTHEVTNAEYRRLFPAVHEGDDNLPAVQMSWYEAYTYAAWLGGRLPTEWEWEYAAKAGCGDVSQGHSGYCKRDGSEATVDEVAWWLGNSVDPETGDPSVKAVMQLEPNPWGLWDVYGNAWEWSANWTGLYTEEPKSDPPGPTNCPLDLRTRRGGGARDVPSWVTASVRGPTTPDARVSLYGLRVVIERYGSGSTTRKP